MYSVLKYFRFRLSVFAVALLAGTLACSASDDDAQQVCIVKDKRIDESSGLAISYACSDAVWIHNDSGDKPRLFLVGFDGETRAVVNVSGADARDWEDMCSFRIGDQSWLLIGDIGDNDAKRSSCRLYLLKEPAIPHSNFVVEIPWSVTATIKVKYEDGPRNCEGLAVDVERREILLLSKSVPQDCGLYVLPLDLLDKSQKHTAKRIASPFIPFATALDISPGGRTMVVGSMLNGLVVDRQPAQSWKKAFGDAGKPITLPSRKQGETICFSVDGNSLYLNSEKTRQPLWRIHAPESSSFQ